MDDAKKRIGVTALLCLLAGAGPAGETIIGQFGAKVDPRIGTQSQRGALPKAVNWSLK